MKDATELRLMREHSRPSIREAADAVGIAARTLNHFESGKAAPNKSLFDALMFLYLGAIAGRLVELRRAIRPSKPAPASS